jgi:TolB protein
MRMTKIITPLVVILTVMLALGLNASDSNIIAGEAFDSLVPPYLIGYTEGRNDIPTGQFANWVTQRAYLVKADGTGKTLLGVELTRKPNTWSQFAGWSPDGKVAVIGSHWESPDNAAWEKDHKTFRMTEGWLSDTYLLETATGKLTNVTAIERVSIYNTGLFYLPQDRGLGFTPLIRGISKPYVMDLDGRNKRDVSGSGAGFAYGYSAAPDGKLISYHEDYQVYVSKLDGSDKQHIKTGNTFNFVPSWSPDGQWLLFLSGEHYNCHPYVVRRDGSHLKKLADRGGYQGVVETLKYPDFHSASSDVPVWSPDNQWVFYTAKVGESVELMRVSLDGQIQQLTRSKAGVLHYHPKSSPDGKWVLFGSNQSGTMQLYVAKANGACVQPITHVSSGFCAMHGHWQPLAAQK